LIREDQIEINKREAEADFQRKMAMEENRR
jgi:hypothetical protein